MVGKKIYILGICGTFTASVAKLAQDLGYEVSGCDYGSYPPMSDVLAKIKIQVDVGYQIKHLEKEKYAYFIIGNVITRGNPMLEYILDQELPFLSASDWIKQNVLKNKKVIAVTGTHGKTSTSAMIAHILKANRIDCGYLIGGIVYGFSANAHLGKDKHFVIEADEYDSAFFEKYPKFMHYHPEILLINNLEFDHGDIYANLTEIQTHFHYLLRTLPSQAKVIMPKNNKTIEQTVERGFYSKKFYWSEKQNDSVQKIKKNELNFTLVNNSASEVQFNWLNTQSIKYSSTLNWQNKNLSSRHNAQNAAGAILASLEIGLSLENCVKALQSFKGVARRMDLKFSNSQLKLFEDFAHHPTAIKSTLSSLRKNYPSQKILAIFDPASNTMKNAFHTNKVIANSFNDVDSVLFYQPKNVKINTKKIANLCIAHNCTIAKSFSRTNSILSEVVKIQNKFDIIIVLSNAGFDNLVTKLIIKL